MKTKILMVIASVLLIIVYFVPIWMISIEAPQFPEGLGLWIKINDIVGFTETDLKSLNTLNHYIGMKEINPETIPEFKIMPIILAGFIVLGIVVAFIEKPIYKYLWIILLIIAIGVGIYDYYLWGYDYGHNLDPHAIIKVEGMTYQPPLIGKKQLLNITAYSYPYIGAGVVAISIILAFISARLCQLKVKGNENKN
jgi:copper chaperone NosL